MAFELSLGCVVWALGADCILVDFLTFLESVAATSTEEGASLDDDFVFFFFFLPPEDSFFAASVKSIGGHSI